MFAKIRPRRSTKSEWEVNNPILLEGEIGIEVPDAGVGTGFVKAKFGDGTTSWNDLPYGLTDAAIAIYGGSVDESCDIYLRNGTTADWEALDPVLGLGEIVFDVTEGEVKVGDGIHKFSELTYIGSKIDFSDIDLDFGDEDETSVITSSLRIRRGKKTTAEQKNIVLKKGEVFMEVPELGVGKGIGRIKMGDGVTPYTDLPYFTDSGKVRSVNYVLPDDNGNIDIKSVPFAENLISPDNIISTEAFIFRTSGGSYDIQSGDAELTNIYGSCLQSTNENGENDNIVIANPIAFKSIGANQFDNNNILPGYGIDDTTGTVIAKPGYYLCYVHARGGLADGYRVYSPDGYITLVGWGEEIPTTTSTYNYHIDIDDIITALDTTTTYSNISFTTDGYLVIEVTDAENLNVHPRWTGLKDENVELYSESLILIPEQDINGNYLPTAIYGFPSVHSVRDEIDYKNHNYIQRIGHYEYSDANLDIVKAMGVDYIYDSTHIFYVLENPITYQIDDEQFNSKYTVSDYGIEEFLGTVVPVYATIIYGQNLLDKLRRDVLVKSPQTLSLNEQTQVQTNLNVACNTPTFDEATTRDNIESQETIPTILGKIKKWFSDLKSLAFKDKAVATYTPEGEISAPNITIDKSTVNVPNVIQVGSLPSLSISSVTCDDITGWSAGSAMNVTVANGIMKITANTVPSLTYTAKTIGSASNWTPGTLPTLGDSITVMNDATATSDQPIFTGTEATIESE